MCASFPPRACAEARTHLTDGIRGQCSGKVLLVGKDEEGGSGQALEKRNGGVCGLGGQPGPSPNPPEHLESATWRMRARPRAVGAARAG